MSYDNNPYSNPDRRRAHPRRGDAPARGSRPADERRSGSHSGAYGQRSSAHGGSREGYRGSDAPRRRAGEPSYRSDASARRSSAGRAGASPRPHARQERAPQFRSAQDGRSRARSQAHRDASGRYATPGSRPQARPGASRQRAGRPARSQGFRLPQLMGANRVPTGYRLARAGGSSRGLNTNVVTAIVGIVVVATLVIVGILMWSNRSVEITLNGEKVSVRVGSTVEQVISEQELAPEAGNLISVAGDTLETGTGYAYLAKLGGNEMDGATTAAYRVSPGDELTIENGRDRTEDYDVQVVEEQPKLEMGGDAWGNISYISQWPSIGKKEMRTGKRSGKTAEGDTLQETKNAVVSVHQIKPDDGKKLVALTFDDGPAAKYTEAYLDILNQYGIHATFFNLGNSIQEYPDLAKKIVEQGSEVMSHTQQHQQLSLLDAPSLQKELSDTFSAIESATGTKTTSFRPPYGDFTEKAWLNSGGLASVSVLWNQDSEDWKLPGVEKLVSNSLKNVTSGSIILMHDGGGNRDQDVQALSQIIQQLQDQGYEFVTVTELMKSDSSIPAEIANGDAAMPEGCTWPTEIASSDDGAATDGGASK